MKIFKVLIASICLMLFSICGYNTASAATYSLNFYLTPSQVILHKPIGTEVGTFTLNSPNPIETYTFTLVAGDGINDADNGLFYIVGDKLFSNSTFDDKVNVPYLYINVQINDSQANVLISAKTIITSTFKGPYALELSSTTISSNAPIGTTVGTLSTGDDHFDQFIYTLTIGDGVNDADNGKFTINNNTLATITSLSGVTQPMHINIETKEVKHILKNHNLQSFADYANASMLLQQSLNRNEQAELNNKETIFSALDGTQHDYTYLYWMLQELPTDEVVCSWNDTDIYNLDKQAWSMDLYWAKQFKTVLYYNIFFCNEFIKECEDSKLANITLTPTEIEQIKSMKAEARFYRALFYWNCLDMFGEVPLVTESMEINDNFPQPSSKQAIFNFIEAELIASEATLPASGAIQYGQINKAGVWMLLSKLYLNAEVYINQPKYTECITYTEKVISSSWYQLDASYRNLFKADNNISKEIITPIIYDGISNQTYGGTTYITHAAIGGSMVALDYGINSGWGGNRSRKALVQKFGTDLATDSRAMFYSTNRTLDVTNIGSFTKGYSVIKFININSDGTAPSNTEFVDIDFPLFRLADAYLMFAEAVLRADATEKRGAAVMRINDLRMRAYGNSSKNIFDADLSLDFILDERARELFWEGHRRTDLIRFGKFTGGNYLWEWKGGVLAGAATDASYNLYPFTTPEYQVSTFTQPFVITTNTTSLKTTKQIELVISPNPVSNVLNIDGVDFMDDTNYAIYAIDGQIINSGKLANKQINVEALPSGNYLLQLENSKGIITKRIIKR